MGGSSEPPVSASRRLAGRQWKHDRDSGPRKTWGVSSPLRRDWSIHWCLEFKRHGSLRLSSCSLQFLWSHTVSSPPGAGHRLDTGLLVPSTQERRPRHCRLPCPESLFQRTSSASCRPSGEVQISQMISKIGTKTELERDVSFNQLTFLPFGARAER